MQKVLIVTYYWPPGSGAGVQRWLKFAKYLPQYGWEPVIITVDPRFATYPAIDDSLNEDVPPGLAVYKTSAIDYFRLYNRDKSLIPSAGFAQDDEKGLKGRISRFIRGNFFIPDPRRGWNRPAFKKACELIIKENITRVITTSPPHSTQLIGLKLKKRFPSVGWIADFRDPWTDIYYYDKFSPTPLSKAIDRSYEKKVLKNADRIITVGNSLKNIFAARCSGIEKKTIIITNGYDDQDFEGPQPSDPEIFTISYIGTLSDDYPTGTFLEVLASFAETDINCKLRFIGKVAPGQKRLIDSLPFKEAVEFIPYSDHSLAISYMRSSSVLLLIIPDHKSSAGIITGKLFEYLASCRPVICLGPVNGDASLILRETGHGRCFDYRDSVGVSAYLNSVMEGNETVSLSRPEEYSRQNLALKVAETLT
jgi:glycosyltransferase involved in cell wall biosynthesis